MNPFNLLPVLRFLDHVPLPGPEATNEFVPLSVPDLDTSIQTHVREVRVDTEHGLVVYANLALVHAMFH